MPFGFFQLNAGARTGVLPSFPEGHTIPKIWHQTYRSRELPAELAANAEHIKRMNPGWTYALYDDADIEYFIKTEYGPGIFKYYQRLNPKYGAARADLFRYLLIYRVGGVYLDIKSTTDRPLDEVIKADDRFILARWPEDDAQFRGWGQQPELTQSHGAFQQWHIIAAPGHPFLKAVIEFVLRNLDSYVPALHGTGAYGVLRVTGPIAYTIAIFRILEKHPYRLVADHSDLSLRYSIFEDPTQHRARFGPHYTTMNEPIVHTTGMNRLVSMACLGARSVLGDLRRLGAR